MWLLEMFSCFRVLMSESRKIINLVTPSLWVKISLASIMNLYWGTALIFFFFLPVVLSSDCQPLLKLIVSCSFKKKTFRKKQSPDGRSPGVDLHHGDRGVDGGGALASLQSHRPFDLNVTDSSLVLLADQALAQETPQCRPSAQQWCAAVGVARLPPAADPLGFPLSDSCQVVLPPFLEVAAFATRHVDAGEAQVLRADANITIQWSQSCRWTLGQLFGVGVFSSYFLSVCKCGCTVLLSKPFDI